MAIALALIPTGAGATTYFEFGAGTVGFSDAPWSSSWFNPLVSVGTDLYQLPLNIKLQLGTSYRMDTGLKDGTARGVSIVAPYARVNYADRFLLGLSWSPLVFFQDPSSPGITSFQRSTSASAATADFMVEGGQLFAAFAPWLRHVACASATLLVGDGIKDDLFRGDPGRSLWVVYEARVLLKVYFGAGIKR